MMTSKIRTEVNQGANSRQVGGDHYSKYGGLQHWDIVNLFKLDYFQGQITKYVFRFRDKNGVQDLQKAKHFLEKLIEIEEKKDMTTFVSVFSVNIPAASAPDPCTGLPVQGTPFEFKPTQVCQADSAPEPINLKDHLPSGWEKFRLMREGDLYNRIDSDILQKYPHRSVPSSNPKKNNGSYSIQWKIIGCVYYYQYNSKITAIRVPHLNWYLFSHKGFKGTQLDALRAYIDVNTPKESGHAAGTVSDRSVSNGDGLQGMPSKAGELP